MKWQDLKLWIGAAAVAATATVTAVDDMPEQSSAPDAATAHAYSGEPLTLNFQHVQVRSALQLIADFAGLNLVAGDDVNGSITLRLVDVPWDEALDLILATNGLGKRRSGNVLLVAPAETLAAREKLELERRQALAELAPLATEFMRIRYADAGELAALLAGGDDEGAALALSDRGRVLVDDRTNSVILTDTADRLAAVRQVIAQLDIPVRQVRIEARVVSVGSNFSEQLGIRWGGGGYRTEHGVPHLKLGGSLQTLGEIQNIIAGGSDSGAIGQPDHLVADLGVQGQGVTSIGIGITGAGYLLDVELSALAAAGHAEIVARPKVITADKRPATIESGVEIPFQQATVSGATSIAFKEAVLQLQVTPRITPDDRVVMDLAIKQDTVGRIYHGVPSVNTTRIATRVLVDDGNTVVLGGIFQADRHQSASRTPVLGDLPVLGRLFRRTLERDDKQELFVFITPEVLRPETVAAAHPNVTPPPP